MANEDDFTFCSVSPPVNAGEAQKVAGEYVKGISVENDIKNGGSIWNIPPSQRVGETVGSLSFNVIDASTSDKQLKRIDEEVSGSSKKALSSDAKAPKAKAIARAKVPFEKGYSQMDWLKLTRTHPDLAGLKGRSNTRLIPMSEVKQHRSEDSMWTVLKGRVYNITTYMKFHPGGDELMKGVGRDCTSLFNKHHAWVNAEFLLEKCLVGILDDGKKT